MFHFLLEADTIRGPHSTGVLFVRTNGEAEVVKKLGTPWDLYDNKQYQEADRLMANVLMGHNRWATRGKISAMNAHPFEFDNIIGAHNGTLNSTYALDDSYKFDVDSEALFNHMNNNGVEDTIRKANGAFALTWWDKGEGSLNLLRNDQRTLFWAHSVDSLTIFWASEEWMISVGCAKYGVKIGPIMALLPLMHHKFFVPLGIAKDAQPFTKAVVRKLEAYVPYVAPKPEQAVVPAKEGLSLKSHQDHMKVCGKELEFYVDSCEENAKQPYIQAYASEDNGISIRIFPQKGGEMWRLLSSSTNFFKAKMKQLSIQGDYHYLVPDLRTVAEVLPPPIFSINGNLVKEERWISKTKCGCSWCSAPPTKEEVDTIYWIDDDTFVCASCQEAEAVIEYLGARN